MINAMSLDIYPAKTQFFPGDEIELVLELPSDAQSSDAVDITVHHLHQPVLRVTQPVQDVLQANGRIRLQGIPAEAGRGYHVACQVTRGAETTHTARTAFDVLAHWHDAPRYGFLHDFGPTGGDEAKLADVARFFRQFHLNVVQYYDWMARHDDLVPKSDDFVDPMGRQLSTPAIRAKLTTMRDLQSTSMAYGAVYASLQDYAKAHPESGLFDNNGVQYSLIERFYLMDIHRDSTWHDHIIEQFESVVKFGFEGIHMDQYGFPKTANRAQGDTVWMDDAYIALIEDCRATLGEHVGLIFNAVTSFPLHQVCAAPQDAVYVEVWTPMLKYRHLRDIVARVRQSGHRQPILAAYLHPFLESSDAQALARTALLTAATIFASGGYHLLLGETGAALTEAYYPTAKPLDDLVASSLRNMYDILTADGELLSAPSVHDVTWSFIGDGDVRVEGAPTSIDPEVGTIWVRVTKTSAGLVVHFINYLWLANDQWNVLHDEPFQPAPALQVTFEWNFPFDQIVSQSANQPGWQPSSWAWVPHIRGRAIQVDVPAFDIWTMVFIPYQEQN